MEENKFILTDIGVIYIPEKLYIYFDGHYEEFTETPKRTIETEWYPLQTTELAVVFVDAMNSTLVFPTSQTGNYEAQKMLKHINKVSHWENIVNFINRSYEQQFTSNGYTGLKGILDTILKDREKEKSKELKYKVGDTLQNDEYTIRICGADKVKKCYKIRTIKPKKWIGTVSYHITDEDLDNRGYKLKEIKI